MATDVHIGSRIDGEVARHFIGQISQVWVADSAQTCPGTIFALGDIALYEAGCFDVPIGCSDGDYDIHLSDSFGDGWNGATLSVSDCQGTLLADGLTIADWGSFSAVDVCIPAAGYFFAGVYNYGNGETCEGNGGEIVMDESECQTAVASLGYRGRIRHLGRRLLRLLLRRRLRVVQLP